MAEKDFAPLINILTRALINVLTCKSSEYAIHNKTKAQRDVPQRSQWNRKSEKHNYAGKNEPLTREVQRTVDRKVESPEIGPRHNHFNSNQNKSGLILR